MRVKLPRQASRLAGILATLVRHLKKGYEVEYCRHSPSQIAALETAFRYLGVSARRFRESLTLLRMAANWFGYSIKILSIFVLGRFRERLFAARQSQGQTSHCGQTHSCLQSDAKIHTASSVRTKSCDDSACPSLGVINDPCVQLAEMLDYPSPLAVLLESLERKGVRLDESDLNDLDITNKNHYVVVIGASRQSS